MQEKEKEPVSIELKFEGCIIKTPIKSSAREDLFSCYPVVGEKDE